MKRNVSRSGRRSSMVLALAAATPLRAQSVERYYVGPSGGFWNTAGNWSTIEGGGGSGGVPLFNDTAYLRGVTKTVNFDGNYAAASPVGQVSLDSINPSNTVTLSQTSASAMAAVSEIIGDSGRAVYTQTAGSNSIHPFGAMVLGQGSGSNGTYNLGGTGSLTAKFVHVGWFGTGAFNQTGGTLALSADGRFNVGVQGGSLGTATISGGTVSAANAEFRVGYTQDSTGTVTLSNSADVSGGHVSVGYAGAGTFTQTGGTHTVGGAVGALGNLDIGVLETGNGIYNLSGTGVLTVSGSETLSFSGGAGTFVQTGGTHSIGSGAAAEGLFLARESGIGSYSLSGSGSLAVNGSEYIGNNAVGIFEHSAGNNTVGNGMASDQHLYVGVNSGASGTYNLSGTGILAVNGNEFVGLYGAASFVQTGGTNVVGSMFNPTFLSLGHEVGGSGTYGLSGAGILETSGPEYVGYSGTGAFNQSGGTHTVGNTFTSQDLSIGVNSGAFGTYNLSGTGSLTVTASTYVGGSAAGAGGAGVLNISDGATVSSATMRVWDTPGTAVTLSGNASLTVGTLNTSGNPSRFVWTGGALTLTNSGLTVDIGGALGPSVSIGSGKTLKVMALDLGNTGPATLSQSGSGNVTLESPVTTSSPMYLGTNADASGTYNLSGTGSLMVHGPEYVGLFGAGAVVQTGGTHTVGTVDTNENLFLGYFAGASGAFSLSGTGSLTVNGNATVGGNAANAGGAGVLNVSGGSMTVTGNLKVWDTPGTSVNLSGGTMTVGSLDVSANAARVNWTGGSLNLTNSGLLIDAAGPIGDSVSLASHATLNTSGAITNNGLLAVAGGSVTAAGLTNNGLLSGSGTLAGTGGITNNGQITQSGGNLVLNTTGGLVNNNTITLASGQFQMNVNVDNHGTVELNGAIIVGAAQLNNSSDGTLIGPGTISTPLLQLGMLVAPQGTTRTGSFVNSGVVQLSAAGATLGPGGQITNASTIEGHGKISMSVVNNGTIEATGGTLTLAGALTMNATGTLAASTGNKILLQSAPGTNSGSISLTGGTLDLNNQAMTNGASGVISGRGTIRGGGTGITNQGQIQLSAGNSDLYAIVKNQNKVIISGNAAGTFYSPVQLDAASEFRVSAGSSAVFFAAVTGSGSFTGSGTKYFEAGNPSPAMVASMVGDTIVESPAVLTTGKIDEDDLTVHGQVVLSSGGGTSTVNTLSVDGTVDLTNNKLIIADGAHGAWTGSSYSGITGLVANDKIVSSSAQSMLTGVAIAAAGDIGKTDFGGVSVAADDVLLMLTYAGDANLSGNVDADDYFQLDSHYGRTDNASKSHFNGDFNYDGVLNGDDYAIIDAGFSGQGTPFGSGAPALAGVSSVPEPALLALIPMAAALMTGRRRR